MKGRFIQHQRGLAENRSPRPLWLVVLAVTAVGAFGACSDVSFQIVPCKRDTDCKFDRICDRDLQACVFPLTKSPTDPSVGSGSVPPMNTGSGGAAAVGSGGGQTTGPGVSTSSGTTTSSSSGSGGSGGSPPDPECILPSDCPGADSTCGYRTCIQQKCGFAYAPLGTPCSDGGGGRSRSRRTSCSVKLET